MVEHWSSNPEDEGSIPSPEDFGVAFFATGPGLGLIMYILTTLQFHKHNFDFHLKNYQFAFAIAMYQGKYRRLAEQANWRNI